MPRPKLKHPRPYRWSVKVDGEQQTSGEAATLTPAMAECLHYANQYASEGHVTYLIWRQRSNRRSIVMQGCRTAINNPLDRLP